MTREHWLNNWFKENPIRADESEKDYDARARHAWTTHNEDPGAGIITDKPDQEMPAGDPGPIPEASVEAVEGSIGKDSFAQLVDVVGAPGYRVGRRHYDADWNFFRPGEVAPNGPYESADLAREVALDDHDEREEARLAGERPIGRKVEKNAARRDAIRDALGRFLQGDDKHEQKRIVKDALAAHGAENLTEIADAELESFHATFTKMADAHRERRAMVRDSEHDDALSARIIARLERRPSAPVVALKETVILESPYAGDVERNVDYARRAMADCLSRGEAPFASHLLYTQIGVLDDSNAEERERGIEAGFMVGAYIEKAVFYIDHGLSAGMRDALERFVNDGKEIVFRRIEDPGMF